ncbi:hypothetical protein REPUB_Repub16aG0021300 [Reevesia pubescens]
MEIHLAMFKKLVNNRAPRWVKWSPPSPGVFILNFNGAMKVETSLSSTDGLIRDNAGNWLKRYIVNIGVTNSLMAELWGVREGLLLAKSVEIHKLVVELDAAVVVHFLTEGVVDSHPCSVLVNECLSIMEG